ncbi:MULTISPECIES: GLPGLI family protein [Empedobacter]|uniref:GLPGLI family protein n=1 Tax=Empedobacter falsenii TaxID=343874 RepID=A0A427BRL6_9FLAO|nr:MULTISPECIES: GLPGLI family protein [Empedobacter]MDH0658713.1 GLPGLI family protein [Empedobacter sp. GD03865]MDH0674107.1 GLPGLI family protein [Empedobacter sp. GD03861]MDH1602115.1 GLPGLI family protein [Empedobacter sp. GD03739]RRT93238.1 GLPGLI family protein [Empedobacter falsenii]RRT93380.1 GLPGLI family protein [Empedobacter falsenii]
MLKYLFLILPIIGFAQDAVRVEYEVRQEFDRSNLKQTSARMEEMLVNSENKRYYFELFVNATNSNFTEIERINNEQNRGTSFGLTTNISATIFKDFNAKELYENSIMKPKLFIKDSIQSFPWILSKDEATILGYKVKKAIYTNSTQTVEAWYAPDLPFRDGPSRFNGLPGLILKIKFKLPFTSDMDTNVSFTAIDLKPYAGKIEIPNKSKKVTKEEYDKEIEKSMGKSGGMINQGVEKD